MLATNKAEGAHCRCWRRRSRRKDEEAATWPNTLCGFSFTPCVFYFSVSTHFPPFPFLSCPACYLRVLKRASLTSGVNVLGTFVCNCGGACLTGFKRPSNESQTGNLGTTTTTTAALSLLICSNFAASCSKFVAAAAVCLRQLPVTLCGAISDTRRRGN